MKRAIYITALSLILCSCASDTKDTSSGTVTSAQTTTSVISAVTTTTVPDESEPETPQVKYKTITAEATDYCDGTLYFTYEGKDYALPMSERLFWEGNGTVGMPRREKTLSEKIIRNKFGEKVMGLITINEDMTSIKQCNVIGPNVTRFENDYPYIDDEKGGFKVDPDRLYSFKKTTGSKCVVSNKYHTYEFDLNDLGMGWKLRYDDEYPIVCFSGYKFKSGNMIPVSICPNRINEKGQLHGDSAWMKPGIEDSIGYFGTVLKNENGIAEILLNDGKTVIVVPSYFNDGEVKEGMQVMVDTWQTEEKLYGTGKRAEFKEVLIWTMSYYYIHSGKKAEDLAYTILAPSNTDITKEKFEKMNKEE